MIKRQCVGSDFNSPEKLLSLFINGSEKGVWKLVPICMQVSQGIHGRQLQRKISCYRAGPSYFIKTTDEFIIFGTFDTMLAR